MHINMKLIWLCNSFDYETHYYATHMKFVWNSYETHMNMKCIWIWNSYKYETLYSESYYESFSESLSESYSETKESIHFCIKKPLGTQCWQEKTMSLEIVGTWENQSSTRNFVLLRILLDDKCIYSRSWIF